MTKTTCYACRGLRGGRIGESYWRLEYTDNLFYKGYRLNVCTRCGCIISYEERGLTIDPQRSIEEEYLIRLRNEGKWKFLAQLSDFSEVLSREFNRLQITKKDLLEAIFTDPDLEYFLVDEEYALKTLAIPEQTFLEIVKEKKIPLYNIAKCVKIKYKDLVRILVEQFWV